MTSSERTFWLGWILVTVLAFVIVIPTAGHLPPIVADVFSGLVVGLAQWVALRRRALWAPHWIWTTTVGFCIPTIAIRYLPDVETTPLPFVIHLLAVYAAIGTGVGVSQWFVLRQRVLRSGWWILTNTVGYIVSMFVLLLVSNAVEYSAQLTQVLASAIIGLVLGAATGIVMVWLLRHPRAEVRQRNLPPSPGIPGPGPLGRLENLVKTAAPIFLTTVLLIIASLAGTWLYTSIRLEMAKREGIYASPERGIQAHIARGWTGVERIDIEHAGPNQSDGNSPHVWFVVANVWAESRQDGSPLHERGYDVAGAFFIQVEEGWVYVPEGAFPEFIGLGMRLFNIGPIVGYTAGTPSSEDALGIEFLEKPSSRHIRVMSFNVGWDSIFAEDDSLSGEWRSSDRSAEFERILTATTPDVICLQEINPARDPQLVANILDAVIPLRNGEGWRAHSGQDNVIAARFDLQMRDEEMVHLGDFTDFGHAMALVDLPDEDFDRDLYVICTHFRAQDGQANVEARQEHADAIIGWMRDIQTPGGEISLPAFTPIIVLGDLNVYDTDPAHHLTTLITGDIANEDQYGSDWRPDWDGSDLADVLPRHNGVGEDIYTWRDDTQPFNPGALDRILYTDSVISVDNSFVLNTMAMTQVELSAVGLVAGDVTLDPESGLYDHLPLAVDVQFHDRTEGD